MTLPTCHCGAPPFAIKPGRDAVTTTIRAIDTDVEMTLIRGARDEAWCWAHWPWRPAEQPSLFTEERRR